MYPQNKKRQNIINRHKNLEPISEFAQEHEVNKNIFFPANLLIKNKNKSDFKVYRKRPDENDLINFHSQHIQKIKS